MLGTGLGQRRIAPLVVVCLALGGLAFLILGFGVSAQVDPASDVDTILEPDAAGIDITPTNLSVIEGGQPAEYYIVLSGRPRDPVTIYVHPDGQTMTDFAYLLFDQGNWKESQKVTVEAVDDDVAEGQHPGTVSHSVSSQDLVYAALQPDDVSVSIDDDDAAGIEIVPTNLSVIEGGQPAEYYIVLSGRPRDPVTIYVHPDGQTMTDSAYLLFDQGNWKEPQKVTVEAVDDNVAEGQHTGTISHSVSSQDLVYAALQPDDVSVSIDDDDAADIDIVPTNLSVIEGGQPAEYYIVLSERPRDPVMIYIHPDDQTMADFAYLLFHQGNWEEPQMVTVAAVDDLVAEGQHAGAISHSVSSQDPGYAALKPDDVTVSIQDNDVAGVEVTPIELTVSEPLGTAIISFRLTSQPANSLTLPLTTSNDECGASPATLVFDSDNWNGGLAATVSAVDDAMDDGDLACWIRTGPISSSDSMYDGMDPDDIEVTVEDDDLAGITISPTSLTISEPSGWAVFTMTLNSEPTAAVTIPLVVSNDECAVSADSVTLQSVSWQTDVTMRVTARDDDLTDGRQTCIVHTEPANSADPKYRNLDPVDVTITVDDDEAGWMVYLPLSIRNWPPRPSAPALQPIENEDGDGSYIVDWSAVALADTYMLEEARDAAFAAPVQLHVGPETSFPITERGAARYHYRVRALNNWGAGAWSAVQAVDVLWEAEPNDTVILANGPLATSQTYYGAFPAGDGDNDYFFIDLTAPQKVELWLRSIPAGSNYDLILRRDDVGWPIVGYSGENGNSDEHIITASPLDAGRYYIQIFNRWATESNKVYQMEYSP